jgi:hypothetical protein
VPTYGAKKFMQEDITMRFLSVARQQVAIHQLMQPRPNTMSAKAAPTRLRRQGFLITLVLALAPSVVAATLGGENLLAQTLPSQATKPARQRSAAANPVQPSLATQPPASPAPIRAANQPPNEARVTWDNSGLEIEASNSSLNEILHQVAADTGAKLEGLAQDQRVFGNYGPGPESDVIWKLLDGSGYNVLVIGGRGTGTPLEIVLSVRSPASPQTETNNQNRNEQSKSEPPPNYPPEPPRPEPVQNPFGNGEPPRDPMQFMQEILQRQQQIDQQQNNPHY